MIFTPSLSPKWKKIQNAKKLLLYFGIQGQECTYKYFKNKKKIELFIISKWSF